MKTHYLVSFLFLFSIQMVSYAQKPHVIAHRGSWKNTAVPQNSLASLNKAIEQGVWGSEFDVHLTKDDILVVTHDNDFYGIDIATATYQELLSKKHPNGESIPTAEAYLKEGLKQKKTKLIFELKTNKLGKERTLKSVHLALDLVKKLKAENAVEFIAFDYDACLEFRKLDKKVKIHYLNGDKTPEQIKEAKLTGVDYHFSLFKKNENWIEDFKKAKLKTNVWTVNSEADMLYFMDKKIDYITTDEPELLKNLLSK